MGSYNNWNNIHMLPKSTPFETFDEIHQVVLDGISDNMALLVQSGKSGIINTVDTITNKCYVIKFISEEYTLQNNTTIYGQIISADELVVKEKYIFSMQENSNWYWKQQQLQQNIIVTIRIILHLCLDVVRTIDVKGTPKLVCNKFNQKNKYKDILFV